MTPLVRLFGGGVRAVFLPVFVNRQFVVESPPPPAHDRATFLGRLLHDRKTLLEHPALSNICLLYTSPRPTRPY
mgnify:CR=1 FL=1